MKTCEHCGSELFSQRTSLQNRSLHKLFDNIAKQFNSHGFTFHKEIQGITFDLRYTGTIIKKEYWADIQHTMFGTNSTTELSRGQIDQVLDVLTLAFGNQGIPVVWPSKFSQWDEMQNKLNN
jgi:hypothetical protein